MKNLGIPVIAAWSVLATAGSAYADETEELRGLLDQSVLSAASRKLEVASAAPATSSTITAEQLRRFGIRTLDEALNFLSMGMTASDVQSSVEVGARGVLLTGDNGNHVLLLVNGHTVNEQWTGGAVFQRGAGIPMELVDHIEVVLGPGSVLYGSGAMLGVINVVTKRAKDYRGVHIIAEAELATSARAAVGAGTEFEYQGDRGEVTVQIEYYARNGPTFTFGEEREGFESDSGETPRSSWGVAPAGHLRAILGKWELNVRASRYQRALASVDVFGNPTDPDSEDDHQVDSYASADLVHRTGLGGGLQLMTRLYGDLYQYDSYGSSTAPGCEIKPEDCRETLLAVTQWGGIELQPSFDWWQDGASVTTIGVEGRARHKSMDLVQGPGVTSVAAPEGFDRVDGTFGVYAQQAVRPASWLALNAGVRGDMDPRLDGMYFSPRGAASVTPWAGGTFRFIYAEAFRAPSISDMVADSADSADLAPETVRSVEVSLEQRAGTHRVFSGVFRSWWEDMIFLDPIDTGDLSIGDPSGGADPGAPAGGETDASASPTMPYGLADIDNYGVNAGIDGGFLEGKLRYGASLTGAVTRRHDSDGTTQPLTVTPSASGNARLSYDFGGDLPMLAVVGQLLGPRAADRAYNGGFTTKPFVGTSAVLRATVSGDVPRVSGLSYRITADYATASEGPYVVGSYRNAAAGTHVAELSPIDRFRVGVGLRYDFGMGSEP